MPIFDQGYQHWDGELSGHLWRWLTITRHGVRTQLRNRWTRIVLLVSLAPALALAGFLVLWGLFEQQSSLIAPLVSLMRGLPGALRADPAEFRVTMWTLAYYYFFWIQNPFTLLIVLLVGPGLISQDLRFNAIPLYLSRPLRRFDYFLGKLGVIGFFIAAVTIAPAVLAYVLGVAFSAEFAVVTDTFHLLVASILYGLIVILSAGSLMLAFSSLTRRSLYVGAIWIGFWIISYSLYGTLTGLTMKWERLPDNRVSPVRATWTPVVAYGENLLRLNTALLNTESAWEQINTLAESTMRVAGQMPIGRRMVLTGEDMERELERRRANRLVERHLSFPWYWSAGVLAGLFGISVWILSTRVKSLDRLK